ncbi:MAG TPA: OmpA family protein [Desulfomonilia bacterium]
MKRVLILAVMFTIGFTFQAYAVNRDSGITFSLSGGGYTFDSREEINLAPIGMLRLGYDMSEYFGLEIPLELGASDIKRNKMYGDTSVKEGTDVSLMGYRLEGLIYLMPESRFVPYLAVGLGDRNINVEGAPNKDNFVAGYGAGARIFVSEDWFIRADFRHLLVFKAFDGNPVNNLEYTLGLGCYLGDKPKPAPVAVAAPVVVEAPKPAPAPAPVVVPAPAPAPAPVAAPVGDEKAIIEKGRATIDVMFDTNKATIKPGFDDELANFADILKKHPDLKVVIEGYTDNTGPAAFNKKLSQERADAVKDYLVKKLGVDASRLKAVGYGPEKPIADNKTAQGRQKNRRVEAAVDYQIKK